MPISVADCLAGHELSEPRVADDGRSIAYVRSDPDGARVVVRSLVSSGVESVSPWFVRPGRGLGGGCFDWIPGRMQILAVTSVGDLALWDLVGADRLVIENSDGRMLSSPVAHFDGTRVAYVVDQAEVHEFDMSTGRDRRVDSGDFAFVFDPVWRRDRLVWQAWSPPNMPWDESRLVTEDGPLVGDGQVQHQQPQVSGDGGRFGWLDDANGWLNLTIEGWGRVAETFEHGGPTWGERQRSWCFDTTGEHAAFVRNEGGFGRLCTVDLDTGAVVERAKAVHGQLSWRGDTLAAVRTGGKTPTQIVVYDTSGSEWQRTVIEVGPTYAWSQSEALVEPELVRVVSDGPENVELHARLYRSVASRGRLLCWVHGGPTDQWQVTFMPRLAYWIDRGYDVLVPDFRGSTGHGRAYTQALHGRWGVLDVDDVDRILDATVEQFGYDRRHVALLGSSAGGLTVLCSAARRPDSVAGVVVAYPVSDIAALDDVTHRFEAHYNRTLVGLARDTARLSAERSPLAHVERLSRVPVLVFHGTDDRVVPIEQSRRLVRDVRAHGGDVELVEFAGEGHGFRSLDNKIREFADTERFLARCLGDRGGS